MGDDHYILPAVFQYDPANHRQSPGDHIDACLSSLGRKSERVLLPGSILLRELRLNIRAAHALPVPVMNFAQTVLMDQWKVMRERQDGCRLDCARERAAVDRFDGIICQP